MTDGKSSRKSASAQPEPLLTLPQAAEYLNVCQQTIRRRLRAGQLHGWKFGREWRFSRKQLRQLLDTSPPPLKPLPPRKPSAPAARQVTDYEIADMARR